MKLRRKYFTPESKKNFVIFFFSVLSLPLSIFFSKLKISPNQITFSSLCLCVVSFVFLIQNNLFIFCIFFFFSLILDICDGQVARLTNNINNTKLNFDHFSDIFKIFLIFLGLGIFFDDQIIWILTVIIVFLFLFMSLLHESIHQSLKKIEVIKIRDQNILIGNLFKYFFLTKILNFFYRIFFTFHFHTLFLLLIFPFNKEYALYLYLYLILIILTNIYKKLISLSKVGI